jgi:hypothetical protein
MAKYYLIRARLLDSTGAEKRLIWAIKPCHFWQNPVDIILKYMTSQKEQWPNLGFDLTEMKEV